MSAEKATHFIVQIKGQITVAEMTGANNLNFKYSVVYGPDWNILDGLAEGASQTTVKPMGEDGEFVFNMPIDLVFNSTNVYGWPQIAVQVYGDDSFGREVIKGYGAVHFPTAPGFYTKEIRLFAPKSSTMIQQAVAFLTANRPEFIDATTVARDTGRDVTRVVSNGKLVMKLNVVTKDMEQFKYITHETGAISDLRDVSV